MQLSLAHIFFVCQECSLGGGPSWFSLMSFFFKCLQCNYVVLYSVTRWWNVLACGSSIESKTKKSNDEHCSSVLQKYIRWVGHEYLITVVVLNFLVSHLQRKECKDWRKCRDMIWYISFHLSKNNSANNGGKHETADEFSWMNSLSGVILGMSIPATSPWNSKTIH